MAKKEQGKFNFSSFIAWIVGVLVSLAVGSGMIQADKVAQVGLWIPGIPDVIVAIAGWIVVIGAIISIIAALFGR